MKTLRELMNAGRRIAGLDMSTTSSVGLTYGLDSGFSSASAPIDTPLVQGLKRGRSELSAQRVPLWLSNVLQPLGASSLVGVTFSVMQHGLVLLDEQKRPVFDILLWNDERATSTCARLNRQNKADNATGNPAFPGFALPKLLFLKQYQRAKWERVQYAMLLSDYLPFLLTGRMVLSESDGMCNNLMAPDGGLAVPFLDQYGVEGYFPEVADAGQCLGPASTPLARTIGLPEDCLVFAGLADNHASMTGLGLPDNALMISCGTSGTVVRSSPGPRRGPWHIFNDFDRSLFLSILMNCGSAWERFKLKGHQEIRDHMSSVETDDIDQALDTLALSDTAYGLYLDEISRERHQGSRAEGKILENLSFSSLGANARSCLQSIAFGLWARAEAMLDPEIDTVYLTGALSRSPIIRGTIASLAAIDGRHVKVPQTVQTAAVGAIIGGLATGGVYDSLAAAKEDLTSAKSLDTAPNLGDVSGRFNQWKAWRGDVR